MELMDREYFDHQIYQKKYFSSLEEMARVLLPAYKYVTLSGYKKANKRGFVQVFKNKPIKVESTPYYEEFSLTGFLPIEKGDPYIAFHSSSDNEDYAGFTLEVDSELRNSLEIGKIYSLRGIANGINKRKGSI